MKLVVIFGPTAIGKTALSIEVAKEFNGEIISTDAFQIYKEMNIGTAKVEDKEGITHHMIDIIDPNQKYSVSEFQKEGRKIIDDINRRNKLPIITGGTGLYTNGLLKKYNFVEDSSNDIEPFIKKLETEKYDDVYSAFHAIDPESAVKIHKNNKKRIIRSYALYLSKKTIKSNIDSPKDKELFYSDICFIFLKAESKEFLIKKINNRVDEQIKFGLVDEVKNVLNKYKDETLQAFQGIGYKELFPYINNNDTLENCVNKIKLNTKKLAKKQMTWFNNQYKQVNIHELIVNEDNWSKVIEEVKQIIKKFL